MNFSFKIEHFEFRSYTPHEIKDGLILRFNLRSGFLFFSQRREGEKKESLIQFLVKSSAAPLLKYLSTRMSAMPSDKREPIINNLQEIVQTELAAKVVKDLFWQT